MLFTGLTHMTDAELVSLALCQTALTQLEAELLSRLMALQEYVDELTGDDGQQELPLQ